MVRAMPKGPQGQKRREGNPDIAHVSTSYVERQNLTMRMSMRRFTRIHKTLRVTPAMAAGITNRLWSLEDIVAKIDAMAPAAKVRGPYKKRGKEHAI